MSGESWRQSATPFSFSNQEMATNDGNHGTIDEMLERAEAKHVAMQAHPMARDVLVISK